MEAKGFFSNILFAILLFLVSPLILAQKVGLKGLDPNAGQFINGERSDAVATVCTQCQIENSSDSIAGLTIDGKQIEAALKRERDGTPASIFKSNNAKALMRPELIFVVPSTGFDQETAYRLIKEVNELPWGSDVAIAIQGKTRANRRVILEQARQLINQSITSTETSLVSGKEGTISLQHVGTKVRMSGKKFKIEISDTGIQAVVNDGKPYLKTKGYSIMQGVSVGAYLGSGRSGAGIQWQVPFE